MENYKELSTEQLLEKLRDLHARMSAYGHAMGILYYDASTVAPAASATNRGRTLAVLSEVSYGLATGEETGALLYALSERSGELDEIWRRDVGEMLLTYERTRKIPMEEYVAYRVLVNDAEAVWHEAKAKSDFKLFEPYLRSIFDAQKRFMLYYEPDKAPYDTALDTYERGLTTRRCDEFFSALREEIVPLMARVTASQLPAEPFMSRTFPVWKQRKFSDFLMNLIGIDRARCVIGETEHPFTTDFTRDDVRITTHYHEDNLISSMFSVVHEGGHALYELGIGDALQGTGIAGGVSMGVHESQSRLYENLLGRSRAFAAAVLPKLKELFPDELYDVDVEAFYRASNRSEPSLIRTEADELTYCLHVMVRYELERAIFEDKLSVSDLPAAWNEKMRSYLGVEVPDDAHGVLQDSHWSGGSIGYFPSYALGSAYGAQILEKMRESVDVEAAVAAGDFSPINSWLCDNIWQYGSLIDPGELVERVCGAPFDPKCFTRYLTEKYSELYGL